MKSIPYGHQSINSDDIGEVVNVLKSDWLTQGPKIAEFERALCGYTQAKYAVAVSSGTAALHIATLAARPKAADEIITSPITFAASANCALYCGAKPVFADVDPITANIDPAKIAKAITKRTKIIIPVHFAGHPCELSQIRRIAVKYGLMVIEDAAHALGARYRGSKVGDCKYSDMAILSFHPVKSITTGEGGAILTNRKDLYERLKILRNHGITKDRENMSSYDGPWYYQMQILGYNYRITDMQCALGTSQLARIDSFMKKRKEIADRYRKALMGIEQIQLPEEKNEVKSSWHLFPVRLKHHSDVVSKRLGLFEFLRANNVGVQVHYIPVYLHPYYQKLGYRRNICPNAENFYRSEISLPIYPGMTSKQIKFVIAVFKKGLALI